MKKYIATIIGVAALLATVSVKAQVPTYASQTIATSPATLATTVVTNFASPPLIPCGKQQNVFMMFSFNQSGASTSNVVYTLTKSVDGIYFDTNQPITVTVASQGTTRVNWSTNLAVAGVGYLRLDTMANTTALTTMTNFGITYGVKISAP